MQREREASGLPRLAPLDRATMVQAVDASGRGIRVAFFRPDGASDRWGHVIATVEQGDGEERVAPQLVSAERIGSEEWPVSPPLQSLSIEERPTGAVALLVGMWGQHHWSASFEAVAASRRVIVDVACRLAKGGTTPRLGSLYFTQPTWQTLNLQFGPEVAGKTLPGRFQLEVASAATQPVRWKYVVELTDVTDLT